MEDITLSQPKPIKEQKRNEFELGVNPDGTQIGLYRDFFYAQGKNFMNPRAGFGAVDLIFTGRFSNELFPERVGKDRYIFRTALDYGRDLFAKYGNQIGGINQTEFERIQRDYYAKHLVKYIKSLL